MHVAWNVTLTKQSAKLRSIPKLPKMHVAENLTLADGVSKAPFTPKTSPMETAKLRSLPKLPKFHVAWNLTLTKVPFTPNTTQSAFFLESDPRQ